MTLNITKLQSSKSCRNLGLIITTLCQTENQYNSLNEKNITISNGLYTALFMR